MDIWVKAHTFPSDVLTRLQKLVEGATDKGAYRIRHVFAKYSSICTILLCVPNKGYHNENSTLKCGLVCVRARQRAIGERRSTSASRHAVTAHAGELNDTYYDRLRAVDATRASQPGRERRGSVREWVSGFAECTPVRRPMRE